MKNKIFIGEFIGSCFLVMIIVGSGIMAENLTNDNALRLTANTLATGAGLFVLITAFADISGAHFNPFVSLAMYLTKKIKGKLLITYIPAQIFGCLLGVMLPSSSCARWAAACPWKRATLSRSSPGPTGEEATALRHGWRDLTLS